MSYRQTDNYWLEKIASAGGTGGGPATVADGADVTEGAIADAVVAAGASGTVSAKLRRLTTDLSALLAKLPAALGITTAAGSLSIAPASNATFVQSNFPTTVDTNSGNKSASTLRVVLATDQPALTAKLLVTPDSVALPANQSVNVAQANGVTILMNAGATGTGAIRFNPATPATITTGQVTASGSPATLVAANSTRAKLTVRNQDASLSVYVGPATVSSSNGALLKAGESRVFIGATLIQVIAASGSPVVDYVDETY